MVHGRIKGILFAKSKYIFVFGNHPREPLRRQTVAA
jgi:hypothetical protein